MFIMMLAFDQRRIKVWISSGVAEGSDVETSPICSSSAITAAMLVGKGSASIHLLCGSVELLLAAPDPSFA